MESKTLSDEEMGELERELKPSLDTDLVCFHLSTLTVAKFRALLAMARGGREKALRDAIEIADRARLDRPYNKTYLDRARWRANNGTVDQIISDLRRSLSGPSEKG